MEPPAVAGLMQRHRLKQQASNLDHPKLVWVEDGGLPHAVAEFAHPRVNQLALA